MFDVILKKDYFTYSDGIYYSPTIEKLSFPEFLLDDSYLLEDSSFWHRHRGNCITATVQKFPPGGGVIDVGGGNGYIVSRLLECGFNAGLFEPNVRGVVNAKKRGITDIACGLFNSDGVKEGSVFAVGLFDVLEHIKDERSFLSSIHYLLRTDGIVYLTVPAYNALWSKKDDYVQHYRRYSLMSLKKVFECSGFEIIYSTYIFAFLVLPSFILKALPYKLKHRNANKKSPSQEGTFTMETFRSEHINSKILYPLLSPWLIYEQNRIFQGRLINCGASCLLVAKKV